MSRPCSSCFTARGRARFSYPQSDPPKHVISSEPSIMGPLRCSTSFPSTCSSCSSIHQSLSLSLPHLSRLHLLLAMQSCKTAAEWTNADELRLGASALEQSRPDFWVRPTHTRVCGLREDASTLHGLCVENHPKLLGLACLTTASPSRASQLAGWLASRPITCMLRLQRASVRRSHSRRYQQAS